MPALLLIGVLLLAITFFTAPAAHAADTGYNTYDVQKVQAFLGQKDESGKTNAEKLGWDAETPASWPISSYIFGLDYWTKGVHWETIDNELRLTAICINYSELHGTLDVSGCTALNWLYCYSNQLTALDVSGCTALDAIDCRANQLTALNVSGCIALTDLNCRANQLTALNVSGCTALTGLNCRNNQLTTLNVSGCTALTDLNCDENQLTTLDVSQNTALDILYCDENQLTTLDVSKNTKLSELWCCNNRLTTLNMSGCSALKYLDCSSNQLASLDVSSNIALGLFYCVDNQLTALDVSNNTAMYWLWCYNNQLTALDISNNTKLSDVRAHGNPLNAASLAALKAPERFYRETTYTENGYIWCTCVSGEKTVTVKSIGNGYAVASNTNNVYLYTYPGNGCSFVEWQDAVGLSTPELYGATSHYYATSTADTMSITAVFSSVEGPVSFSDVSETDWFYGAVGFVADYGLFAGVGDSQFAPQANMSRAMFVQVLYNLAQKRGMPSASQSYSYTFKDVESGVWYTDAVAWAAGIELVSGYNADTFGTGDNITREQMTVLLIKFADYAELTLNTDGNTSFSDSGSVSNWAVNSVNRTTAAGIMNGSYGAFNPLGNATRAEVAAVFKNMVEQYI